MLALVEIKNMENYLINKELTGEPLQEFHNRVYAIHNTVGSGTRCLSENFISITVRPDGYSGYLISYSFCPRVSS